MDPHTHQTDEALNRLVDIFNQYHIDPAFYFEKEHAKTILTRSKYPMEWADPETGRIQSIYPIDVFKRALAENHRPASRMLFRDLVPRTIETLGFCCKIGTPTALIAAERVAKHIIKKMGVEPTDGNVEKREPSPTNLLDVTVGLDDLLSRKFSPRIGKIANLLIEIGADIKQIYSVDRVLAIIKTDETFTVAKLNYLFDRGVFDKGDIIAMRADLVENATNRVNKFIRVIDKHT